MKVLFLPVLLLFLLLNNITHARIMVVGPEEIEARSYSFSQKQLHNNITNLNFVHYRDTVRDYNKYKASLVIVPRENGKNTAYIELNEIELLTKDLTGKDTVIPIMINSVSIDEYHRLTVNFEYILTDELVKLARLKFYFNVREVDNSGNKKQEELVIYTLNFKDLKDAKVK